MSIHEPLLKAIQSAPLIPVVTIHEAEDALPLAEALYEGGLRCIEVTLRTQASMEAIEKLAQSNIEDLLLGVGTLTSGQRMQEAQRAGAQFFVSPGVSDDMLEVARKRELCYLPGVVTPGEIIQAINAGQKWLKFFPAQSFGGTAMLKQYATVFPQISFCPTGGITRDNAVDYLSLPNVRCVGGSWLTPKDAMQNRDWKKITEIAKASLTALKAGA